MSEIINICERPTYDITQITLRGFDDDNRICYFETEQAFYFDKVYGNVESRSRVTRIGKPESEVVVHIVSATIDAGYRGHLVWKAVLTKAGVSLLRRCRDMDNLELCVDRFRYCQQIHLFSSPAGNYYNGTNQTDLEPDIVFVSEVRSG